jgi:hypothetical protein
MLPLSVLTLALLGGFIFVSSLNWTRYNALRSEGYRLALTSAVFGVVFLFVATVLSAIALTFCWGEAISDAWHWLVPLKHSGKAAMAFLFGAVLWWPLNWLGEQRRWPRFRSLSDEASVDREVEKKRNPLEVIFHQALRARDQLVSVTVKSGKVYIGKVTTTFNPAFGMQAVKLSLSRSGHRDKDTQEMKIDIDYDKAQWASVKEAVRNRVREELDQVARDDPSTSLSERWDSANRRASEQAEVQNYEIVIPIEEVQSANIFDLKFYDTFFASN